MPVLVTCGLAAMLESTIADAGTALEWDLHAVVLGIGTLAFTDTTP